MSQVVAIIGAQKARTSTLAVALERHPQVHFVRNEVAVFENPWIPSSAAQSFAAYLRSRREPVAGFKRADLLGRPEGPEELLRSLGHDEVVLVATLRDPVQRAISALFWYVRQGLLPAIEPNEMITRLLDAGRIEGFVRSNEILEYGLYGMHLDRWIATFGDDRLLVVRDDDVGPALAGRLSELLGIDSFSWDPTLHRKPGHRNVTRARFVGLATTQPSRVPDWRASRSQRLLRAGGTRALITVDRVLLSRVLRTQEIDPGLLQALRSYYMPDLQHLAATHGIDLVTGDRHST